MNTEKPKLKRSLRYDLSFRTAIMDLFDIGPWVAISVLASLGIILVFGIIFFINSAPPAEITLASGPEGSMFHRTALKYQKALETNGVKVNIVMTNGSIDNFERITEPKTNVDLALIQSGVIDEDSDLKEIVSLGAIANQPVFLFYRGSIIDQLTDLKGKTLAIGHKGTGARKIALKLLELNGIKESEPGNTVLLALERDAALTALSHGTIDAAFMMSENVALRDLRKLMRSKEIHLMNFKKTAAAYVRKLDNLSTLDLPEGVLDLGMNIPSTDLTLIGPMVELVGTHNLHPALSDLVLDAATTIHSRPGLFQKRGEFPLAISLNIPLSADADRFYKSGKSLLYRHLPFWIASLLNRVFFVFIPMLIVMIPVIKLIPWLFRWKNQLRIRRLYRSLLQIEESLKYETEPEKIAVLHKNFERIDNNIRSMRVRPAFAEQFYHLRGHIDYVRRIMDRKENQ